MTEIYLIRHAQAEGNRFRLMQGHWDGGVTELGRRQIALLSDRLLPLSFDAVYSSDLYRARLTATAVYRPRELPLRTDPALREINIGPWEQQFFGNLLYEEPESAQLFLRNPLRWHEPGAESFEQVGDRALRCLEEIACRHPGQRVAVVSHGVTLRCLLSRITGLDLRDREKLPMLLNTSVTVLRRESGPWQVALFNDVSHLGPLEQPVWSGSATLRHESLDPRRDRDYYCACYRDAWLAAHGNLDGFTPEPYWNAAREHLRQDPRTVLRILDGDRPVGLVDLDPRRASHLGCGWLSLLYLCPEYRYKGYGIQALGRAVTYFRRQGRRALRLVAAEDNAPALAFYRREGFSCVDREEGISGTLLVLERPLTERRDAL
jgi:probable phosphoglycerate mutase